MARGYDIFICVVNGSKAGEGKLVSKKRIPALTLVNDGTAIWMSLELVHHLNAASIIVIIEHGSQLRSRL
jgi:hypothetical protein